MIEHLIDYPFHRDLTPDWDSPGFASMLSWRPGAFPSDGAEEWIANGMGKMVLTEISRHRPPGYPERVFYVREWVDPDGRRFGKRTLRVHAASHFKAMLRGYRYDFALRPDEEPRHVEEWRAEQRATAESTT